MTPAEKAQAKLREFIQRERERQWRTSMVDHLRETFPQTGSVGRALPAAPTGRGRGRGPGLPTVNLTRPARVGETVTLTANSVSDGKLLWSSPAANYSNVGFRRLTLPTTDVPVSTRAYYGTSLVRLRLTDRDGGTFAFQVNGEVQHEFGADRGREVAPVTVKTGMLAPGDLLSISSDVAIEEAQATFELIDTPVGLASDPPTPIPGPITDNIIGWWMADAIEGVADDGDITTWPDIGPNGFHLTSVIGSPPIFQENEQNSLPVAYMGTSAARRSIGVNWDATLGVAPHTMYVLVRLDGLGGNIIDRQSPTAAQKLIYLRSSGAGTMSAIYSNSTGFAVNAASGAQTGWHIYTVLGAGNDLRLYRDGTLLGQDTSGSTHSWNTIRFGDLATTSGNPMNGAMAEVVLFSAFHDSTQRGQMHSYLTTKWGL